MVAVCIVVVVGVAVGHWIVSDDWVVPMAFLAAVALMFASGAARDRRFRLRHRAELAELPPVCLACMQDLSGLAPQDDGCVVCPECGAAWRVERGGGEGV